MKKLLYISALSLILAAFPLISSGNGTPQKDLSYTSSPDPYKAERCRLDIYPPKNVKNYDVFVWFHGGGISEGNKTLFPKSFPDEGIGVVAVNYRLSPKIKANEAILDAAEAVAWVLDNIEKFGGNPDRVFIGGHSAGAYLAGMVGFNPAYLEKFGHKNTDIAGMCLISGQMTTHFQVKKDLGYKGGQFLPVIDKYAILNFVENEVAPLLIVTGEEPLEWPCRVAENRLLLASVKKIGKCPLARMSELGGYGHNCAQPSAGLISNFIKDADKLYKKP